MLSAFLDSPVMQEGAEPHVDRSEIFLLIGKPAAATPDTAAVPGKAGGQDKGAHDHIFGCHLFLSSIPPPGFGLSRQTIEAGADQLTMTAAYGGVYFL